MKMKDRWNSQRMAHLLEAKPSIPEGRKVTLDTGQYTYSIQDEVRTDARHVGRVSLQDRRWPLGFYRIKNQNDGSKISTTMVETANMECGVCGDELGAAVQCVGIAACGVNAA